MKLALLCGLSINRFTAFLDTGEISRYFFVFKIVPVCLQKRKMPEWVYMRLCLCKLFKILYKLFEI